MRGGIALGLLALFLVGGCAAGGVSGAAQVQVEPITGEGIKRLIRERKAPAALVNVWATWCSPCVEEFPELVRLQRDFQGKGLEMIFVSADLESNLPAVKAFLAGQGVRGRTHIKTGRDMEFIEALSSQWSGAIPATFVFDRGGQLRGFREGKADYATFSRMVNEVLGAGRNE